MNYYVVEYWEKGTLNRIVKVNEVELFTILQGAKSGDGVIAITVYKLGDCIIDWS